MVWVSIETKRLFGKGQLSLECHIKQQKKKKIGNESTVKRGHAISLESYRIWLSSLIWHQKHNVLLAMGEFKQINLNFIVNESGDSISKRVREGAP